MILKLEGVQILTLFSLLIRELRATSTELEEKRPVWTEHKTDNSGIYLNTVKQVFMADSYFNVGFVVHLPKASLLLIEKL